MTSDDNLSEQDLRIFKNKTKISSGFRNIEVTQNLVKNFKITFINQKEGKMMRDFEKISFEQFCKDVCNDLQLYKNYKLPIRDSKQTAGYDIYLLKDLELKPNEIVKLPTGIKSYFQADEVLLIFLRSSMGFNHNIRLVNQVGIIDADYYNNKSNEGHIFVKIQNEGTDTVKLKAGESIVQGIFLKYLITNSDADLGIKRESSY